MEDVHAGARLKARVRLETANVPASTANNKPSEKLDRAARLLAEMPETAPVLLTDVPFVSALVSGFLHLFADGLPNAFDGWEGKTLQGIRLEKDGSRIVLLPVDRESGAPGYIRFFSSGLVGIPMSTVPQENWLHQPVAGYRALAQYEAAYVPAKGPTVGVFLFNGHAFVPMGDDTGGGFAVMIDDEFAGVLLAEEAE